VRLPFLPAEGTGRAVVGESVFNARCVGGLTNHPLL